MNKGETKAKVEKEAEADMKLMNSTEPAGRGLYGQKITAQYNKLALYHGQYRLLAVAQKQKVRFGAELL